MTSLRDTLEREVDATIETHRRASPDVAALLRGHGLRKGTDESISGRPHGNPAAAALLEQASRQ